MYELEVCGVSKANSQHTQVIETICATYYVALQKQQGESDFLNTLYYFCNSYVISVHCPSMKKKERVVIHCSKHRKKFNMFKIITLQPALSLCTNFVEMQLNKLEVLF